MAGARPDAARLQATTLARRLLRVLGRAASLPAPLDRGPAWAGARASGVAGVLPVAGPAPVAADAVLASVLHRARAAGTPDAGLSALAGLWADLSPADRRGVDQPLGGGRPGRLRVGGAPARQTDGTTCGSAVLAMLAAAGDPVLALWLVTGRLLPEHLPPELPALPAAVVTAPDAAVRLSGLQRALKRASTRRAVGPLPWPAALGTPPWGAARTARFPGVRWAHVLVDDTDPALVDAVLGRADAALAAGVPVPLFTGGDLGGGPAAAVPRHVVLLVPTDDDVAPGAPGGYAVYEPGHGRVHRVTRAELTRPGGPHPALGGWSHVCWALLPSPVTHVLHAA